MTQHIGLTGRLYPNVMQTMQIHQTIGAARWIWNTFKDMLDARHTHSPEASMPNYTRLSSLLPG